MFLISLTGKKQTCLVNYLEKDWYTGAHSSLTFKYNGFVNSIIKQFINNKINDYFEYNANIKQN